MKKKLTVWLGCGIFCILAALASSWYAVVYNDSRLVTPMNLNHYTFQPKDLPMILSLSLLCIYIIALFIALLCKSRLQAAQGQTTRKVNPKLGLLGLLGFLGFGGFWTYSIDGSIFPFMFFLFFGFFGFYYEGKMSDTLMDERFHENEVQATLKASNISFKIIFVAFVVLCQGKLFGNLEYTLIAVTITISLALALRLFLAEYLLYRYDHSSQAMESED